MPKAVKVHHRDNVKSKDVVIDNISLMIGGKSLLDNAKIQLNYGRKYGLIGRNGIGKTTLLCALAFII